MQYSQRMQYSQWFHELDQWLTRYRELWQLRPFTRQLNPWARQWPDLAGHIASLDALQIATLLDCPEQAAAVLLPFLPDGAQLADLTRVPHVSRQQRLRDDGRLSWQVPGRKWQQISAFVQALPDSPLPILEWCAGKGHLGRLAGRVLSVPVVSLEIDPQLCAEGQLLADRQQLDQRLLVTDVLSGNIDRHLHPQQQALALHACGDLHVELIRRGSRQRLQSLHLSPCCYHHGREEIYTPLSRTAGASSLRLSRQDRQLAVQESVTAGQRIRRLRDREVTWRLGFDSLQRQLRAVDEYLPVPAVQKQLLSGSFADFCQWAADRKQLHLPGTTDFSAFEQAGRQRCLEVRRLELVSHLFRRPLELWLVLDRVLYLEEQGYEVSLGIFCERALTPRNLLIQAQLTNGQKTAGA